MRSPARPRRGRQSRVATPRTAPASADAAATARDGRPRPRDGATPSATATADGPRPGRAAAAPPADAPRPCPTRRTPPSRSTRRPAPPRADLRAARRPLPQPRAVLAGLQRPGARAGRGPQPAAAGAGQVPGDLRVQPRRVLHGPGGRAEAPRRDRARPCAAPTGSPRASSWPASPPARQALAEAHARVFLDEVRPELDDEGIRILRWDGLTDGAAGAAVGLLHRAGVPGAHPAGGGPGAPVPLHLRAVAEPRRDRARPGGPHRAVRPGQGAQQRAAAGPGGHRGRRRRVDHLPADRGPDRRAPRRAVHRHGGGRGPRLPGHPQRRPGGRGGPRRGPAAVAGARAGPAPVRAAGAARGHRHDERARAGAAAARAGRRPGTTWSPCPACST